MATMAAMEPEDHLWTTLLHSTADVPALWPQPWIVSVRETSDPAYHLSGAQRSDVDRQMLQLSLAGCGQVRERGQWRQVARGQAMIGRINDPQMEYRWSSGPPWRFMFIELTNAGALVDGLVARHGRVLDLSPEDPAVAAFAALRDPAHGTSPARKVLAPDMAVRLAWNLLAALLPSGPALPAPDRLPAEALRLISDRCSELATVKELAAWLGVGPDHLARLFRAAGLPTPHRLLLDARMRLARQFLATDGVTEVARRLGYTEPTNFIRAYRRHYGRPPGGARPGRA